MMGKDSQGCYAHHFCLLEGAQRTCEQLLTNAAKQTIADTSAYSEKNEGDYLRNIRRLCYELQEGKTELRPNADVI